MASRIKLKKSSVPGKVPLATDLEYGELAINYADGRLYYKSAENEIKWFAINELTEHGDLAGLLNDDHTQYIHVNTARTITAAHTFDPILEGAPFILGPNSRDQLVQGLNADLLDGRDSTYFYSPANTPVITQRYTFPESLRWTVVHNQNTDQFSEVLTDNERKRFFANVQIIDLNSFYIDLTTATGGTADVTFFF